MNTHNKHAFISTLVITMWFVVFAGLVYDEAHYQQVDGAAHVGLNGMVGRIEDQSVLKEALELTADGTDKPAQFAML